MPWASEREMRLSTTPFTFFATAEAVIYTGATPVFVDAEPDTLNIDVSLIEKKITKRQRQLFLFIYSATR